MVELSERELVVGSRARGEKGGKAAVSAEAGQHAVSHAMWPRSWRITEEPTAAG